MEHEKPPLKPLKWIGSSKDDLRAFPDQVCKAMGFALYLAQIGMKAPRAKPLHGFGGAGVLEVVDDYDGDTYRAVYTVRFRGIVFVLHAFQKKSKHAIQTPRTDMATINSRLRAAADAYAEFLRSQKP
jgi:phage-related protein